MTRKVAPNRGATFSAVSGRTTTSVTLPGEGRWRLTAVHVRNGVTSRSNSVYLVVR